MRYKIYEIHDSNMMHSRGMHREVPYQFMTELESSYSAHESEKAALDAIRENRSMWVGKSLTILPVIEVPWDEKEEF